VNNFAARKRPCGPAMSVCGVAYLVFLLTLVLAGY
jgi:hypothetical protein